MKKIISFLSVALIAATCVFANVELSEKYYLAPLNNVKATKTVGDIKSTQEMDIPAWVGFDTECSIFFGSPTYFLDLGLGLNVGSDFIFEIKEKSEFGTESLRGIGGDLYFGIGPTARFNLGSRHSFLVNPGFRFNVFYFVTEEKDSAYTTMLGANIDATLRLGYRFWFVHAGGFHFGLAAGTNFSFPLIGEIESTLKIDNTKAGSSKITLDNGAKAEINIGVVFNFGDRSIEKFAD